MKKTGMCLIVIFISVGAFFVGQISASGEVKGKVLKPKVVSEAPQNTQKPKETTEDTKESIPEHTPRRPLKFRKFRATVDIVCSEPRDDDYVRKEVSKLVKLASSVSSAQSIDVSELQGISIRGEEERVYNIDLD